MSVGTYAELSTAIGTWSTRTYTTAQTDEFILLAEAYINRKLGSNYRRKTTATVNTNSSGEGAIPSDCIAIMSLTQDVTGGTPLKQVSWDALIERNPYADSDEAQVFAIRGTTFKVAPVADDDFFLVYWAKVPALTSSNTTNWLLTLAPDAYLYTCRSIQAAFEEEEARAAAYKTLADEVLDDLVSQANVAEYGNAEMTLSMVTP